MSTATRVHLSRQTTVALLLLAPACSNDCIQRPTTTTTVTTPESDTTHTPASESGTTHTPPIEPTVGEADACPTDTIFAFPKATCPTPTGNAKKILRRVAAITGEEMLEPKNEGIDALVCRYTASTSPTSATFLADAEAFLAQDITKSVADCPVFRGQGWTPSIDQRRMRALHQMHRIAAGAAFPGNDGLADPTVRIHVLDSVASEHKAADPADYTSLLDVTSEQIPTSAHGLSVAAVIVDIACGDSPDCRSKLDLHHEQVLKYNAAFEAWGYHKDLAEGISAALKDTSDPRRTLINLSVADPRQESVLAFTQALGQRLAQHKELADIQPDLNAFKNALGPDRFTVFAALTVAWCRGVAVFAAAGNLPADPRAPDPVIEASFPAVLGTLSLRRPTEPANSSTVLCKLLDPKGTIAYGPRATSDPLVWAVGAAGNKDAPLAGSRGKQQVKLYAHGLAVAAANERTGFEVMTGTSGAAATVTAIVARALALSPTKDGNTIVRKTLFTNDPPIGDLCRTLENVCKGVATPACLPYSTGTIACKPRTVLQGSLAKWDAALGAYVTAISNADHTVVIGSQEVKPQPGGQHCPQKFCGVFKSTFVGRLDEHLSYGNLVSLSLRGVSGDVKHKIPLSGGASAGGSITQAIDTSVPESTWAQVAYAVVEIDDDQDPANAPSFSEVPVHH